MSRTSRRRNVLALAMATALVGVTGQAWAQSKFIQTSDVWNNAANWSPNGVPGPLTNCVIGSSTNPVATATIGAGDACYSKYLYLGDASGRRGTLNMTDGTLTGTTGEPLYLGQGMSSTGIINQTGGTISGYRYNTMGYGTGSYGAWTISNAVMAHPAQADVTVAGGASSHGLWTIAGSSVVTGQTTVCSFYVASGSGSVGRIVVDGSALFSNSPPYYIHLGSGQNSDGTVEVRGGKFYLNNGNSAWNVGQAAGGVGRLLVSGGTLHIGSIQGAILGNAAGSTGIVDVSGGVLISDRLTSGAGAQHVYVTNNAVLNLTGTIGLQLGGAAGSNGLMVVDNNGIVTNSSGSAQMQIGMVAGNVSQLQIKGSKWYQGFQQVKIASAAGSTGLVTITGGECVWQNITGGQLFLGGFGAGSLGRTTIQGGSLTTSGGYGWDLGYEGRGEILIQGGSYTFLSGLYGLGQSSIGFGLQLGRRNGSYGLIQMQSGIFSNTAMVTLGTATGSSGAIEITGGTWVQPYQVNVGYAAAGVTGRVSVANCVQTNISGAVMVGGGTAGDRYGSVTVSNATFGGTAAVTVWTNGFVELTGTGSVLRCSTFTCRGGSVTNHVRQVAGGVDITGATLAVTNGGKIHLAFEQDPVQPGHHWGLRWAGNHVGDLEALRNTGNLAWTVTGLTDFFREKYAVGIYNSGGFTYVGFEATELPTAADGISVMVE